MVEARTEAKPRLGQIGGDIEREAALAEDSRGRRLPRLTARSEALAKAREGEAEAQAKAKAELAEAHDAADGLERQISKATAIATLEARRGLLRAADSVEDRVEAGQGSDVRLEEQRAALEADEPLSRRKTRRRPIWRRRKGLWTMPAPRPRPRRRRWRRARAAEEAAISIFRDAESALALEAERTALERLLAADTDSGDARHSGRLGR